MEWTFIIGVLVTLTIIYVHGSGYRGEKDVPKKKRKKFYLSISFWTAFIYTLIAYYLTNTVRSNF
jgi:hypothetical protein